MGSCRTPGSVGVSAEPAIGSPSFEVGGHLACSFGTPGIFGVGAPLDKYSPKLKRLLFTARALVLLFLPFAIPLAIWAHQVTGEPHPFAMATQADIHIRLQGSPGS